MYKKINIFDLFIYLILKEAVSLEGPFWKTGFEIDEA